MDVDYWLLGAKATLQCMSCRGMGHHPVECPSRDRPLSYFQIYACTACQGAGHLCEDCPTLPETVPLMLKEDIPPYHWSTVQPIDLDDFTYDTGSELLIESVSLYDDDGHADDFGVTETPCIEESPCTTADESDEDVERALEMVDEYSRTTVPSIWAVGDVTNRMNLTPVALMEGTCFAKTVFGGQPTKPDYNHIPCAVFCIPPLSVVGLSEQQAIDQGKSDVLVFTSTFNPMKNSISGRQEKTIMKLVVDSETDKVLGASMCGPDAAEIMQGIAVALKCGATKAQFDDTMAMLPFF